MAGNWDKFRKFEEMMCMMYEDFWGKPMQHRFAPSGRLIPTEEENSELYEHQPFIDVIETDGEVIVTAGMPGLEKGDINIKISGAKVEISAWVENSQTITRKGHPYNEQRRRSYYRAIALPSIVDWDKSKAIYNNGVLEVKMQKNRINEKKVVKV